MCHGAKISAWIQCGPSMKIFASPQTNEVRARFDLLTSFRKGNHSVDEWYNAVQAQVPLAKYPPETANILHWDIFWFFLKDEILVSETINDSNIDLEKFPPSRVWQLANNDWVIKVYCMSHKTSWKWPKVNLMRHQRRDLPPSKSKGKQHSHKSRSKSQKSYSNEREHPAT